jgi:ADP-ribose pyrophosphatase YjhB (NUDIX family)
MRLQLHCPRCGEKSLEGDGRLFECRLCAFVYYHNVAAATVAIIRSGDEILFCVRANEPHAGMLDLPGGFQEPGESFEEGIGRELKEELSLDIESPEYLFSLPNTYPFGGVVYRSCDAYFELIYDSKPEIRAADDVADTLWIAWERISPELIAFESMKKALEKYAKLYPEGFPSAKRKSPGRLGERDFL